MKKVWMQIIILLLSSGPSIAQAVTGDITDVIVYRGQALVTRSIKIDGAAGDMELIVENLPARIISESLYAQADNDVKVLSVRYREKTTREDKREEVKKLEQEIEQINKQLHQLRRDRQHVDVMSARFSKYWELGFEGADLSMNRAALSAETIKDLAGFLDERLTKLHEKAVEQELAIQDTEKHLAELGKQRSELAEGHQTVQREAVVYLHKPSDKTARLDLSYLVNNAGWSPQYNLWARPADGKVRMEYLAVVHQASGEDWTSAALALSTARTDPRSRPAAAGADGSLPPAGTWRIWGHNGANCNGGR